MSDRHRGWVVPPPGKLRVGRWTACHEENATGCGATPFANDGQCMGRPAPHTLTLLRVGADLPRVPRFPRSRPPSRPFAPIHAHGGIVGTGQNKRKSMDPLQWGRKRTKRDFWASILGLSRGRDSVEVEKNFKKKFCTRRHGRSVRRGVSARLREASQTPLPHEPLKPWVGQCVVDYPLSQTPAHVTRVTGD